MKVALCFWNGWRERTKISLYQRSKTKSYKKCVNQFYDIVGSIKNANFYSIIIDEISDASNKEQTIFRVFWVDGNLFTQEEFLGLHKMKKTDAIGMSNLIKDIVLRLGFYSKKKKNCGAVDMTVVQQWWGQKSNWHADKRWRSTPCTFYLLPRTLATFDTPWLDQKCSTCFKIIGHFIQNYYPVDTEDKLNVHKTFRRRSGRLLNVLCTFNLPSVSAG